MKLFIEYIKEYDDVFTRVQKVKLMKKNNKNVFEISFEDRILGEIEKLYIPLKDVKLMFMIDAETLEEYFRYEK